MRRKSYAASPTACWSSGCLPREQPPMPEGWPRPTSSCSWPPRGTTQSNSPQTPWLATSMALPLPSQHCLLAKTLAHSQCPPTPPLPFSLPVIFVQRREELLCPPSSQPLEEITGFPGRDAPTPKQIRGPATFSSAGARCCGSPCSGLGRAGELRAGARGWREEASRDHTERAPAPGSCRAPRTLILPSLIPTAPREAALAANRHGCSACPALSPPPHPLARSKVPAPPHGRSGPVQKAQSKRGSGNSFPSTSHLPCKQAQVSPQGTAGDAHTCHWPGPS